MGLLDPLPVWKHLGIFTEGRDPRQCLVQPQTPARHTPQTSLLASTGLRPICGNYTGLLSTAVLRLVWPLNVPQRLLHLPLCSLILAMWTVIHMLWSTKCHLETFCLKYSNNTDERESLRLGHPACPLAVSPGHAGALFLCPRLQPLQAVVCPSKWCHLILTVP